ncbi:uncharacterized protein LOC8288260 isoform X1 [Ricinus communis]|uniref:uncharacterized protein LOC8288260 isoform X1 n=1 Tax=Ricinus communis TaxID=3988 RepID=UPI00201A6C1A|nr:uncharacterized protein LOC8288260 isoform X1 [Ricinus communis]XP_048235308.1 uncharacterized protein LOC8288260 isoform X1 [Ricinus communis]
METLGILEEIESLVSDKLEVVSYKWLSRNFLVSSNDAKRLLQEFAEKHKSGLEVVYALSGWLKNNPQSYHIRLVSRPKLEEAKKEFDGNCSIHVYSVQPAIPKDPAALWNDEFVQAEELFRQPNVADNCLRDNRFCGILNPFVKRNVAGNPVSNAVSQPKSVGIPEPSKSNSAHENIKVPLQQIKDEQSGPMVGKQSTILVKDIKSESHETEDQSSKPHACGEKVLPTNEKKGQGDKSSSSLANLWGRASAKSKLTSAEDNKNLVSNPIASAEAQVCSSEAIEDQSSADEAKDVNFKRTSNGEGSRKRRVVFDFSDDEYEDAVSLASPEAPKEKMNKIFLSEKPNVNGQIEDKREVKEESSTDKAPNQVPREKISVSSKRFNSNDSSNEKKHSPITGGDGKADIVTNDPPHSPKRRKVLKTRIDERGREVNEVVWEGEDTEKIKADSNSPKNADINAPKKAENNAITSTVNNRAPVAKKSPAVGSGASTNTGGNAGNKKGGSKDPKQGNLLSFFKRV